MAAVESASRPHDRHTRRRPFAAWMKRLASLKSSSSEPTNASGKKRSPSKSKKSSNIKNNPYPESGNIASSGLGNANIHLSFSSPVPRSDRSATSVDALSDTLPRRAPTTSNKSAAPTVATNPETVNSEAGQSKAGTSNTVGGGLSVHEGENSTFSSPNHSERSLTTTLTTIQSTAPSGLLNNQPQGATSQGNTLSNQVQFTHQYPVSPPASALPPHLAPQSNPHTYHAATANNMLTDNASILTLASSSKRRRRNSMDTDASVRALAPSSLWGGSRESLPLSVLSSNVELGGANSIHQPSNRPGVGGLANAERASVYSSSGVTAPALNSERNSYYAKAADGASIRSGIPGHGRSESVTGSIGGIPASSPLASPRELNPSGRISRRSSEWKDESADKNVLGGEGQEGQVIEKETAKEKN